MMLGHTILMVKPADWNGDGQQAAIGTDRSGGKSLFTRCAKLIVPESNK